MRARLVAVVVSVCAACAPPLSDRERGVGIGYLVGSGVGAGIGAATGNPALGAVAGGPVGAAAGWGWTRERERDRQIAELQARLAAQEQEVKVLREGVRRLGRSEWLEP
jgi:outer membrane lipoprotein SlyB